MRERLSSGCAATVHSSFLPVLMLHEGKTLDAAMVCIVHKMTKKISKSQVVYDTIIKTSQTGAWDSRASVQNDLTPQVKI